MWKLGIVFCCTDIQDKNLFVCYLCCPYELGIYMVKPSLIHDWIIQGSPFSWLQNLLYVLDIFTNLIGYILKCICKFFVLPHPNVSMEQYHVTIHSRECCFHAKATLLKVETKCLHRILNTMTQQWQKLLIRIVYYLCVDTYNQRCDWFLRVSL